MKILLVGASGAVGSAVAQALAGRHEVLSAGRTHGDYRVDVTSDASVEALFTATGRVDAIVCTTGGMHFGPLADMRPAAFDVGRASRIQRNFRADWTRASIPTISVPDDAIGKRCRLRGLQGSLHAANGKRSQSDGIDPSKNSPTEVSA